LYVNFFYFVVLKKGTIILSPYYHRIKEGETWEKITEDYGITIEDLISLNKRIKIKKPPKKGTSIRVY
ncbi:MAG TPA: LysM domain-containing protein, partial [Bacteroidales bacterium]|nr:LysM domain-containing protein [Bacteroidales bacterium]